MSIEGGVFCKIDHRTLCEMPNFGKLIVIAR